MLPSQNGRPLRSASADRALAQQQPPSGARISQGLRRIANRIYEQAARDYTRGLDDRASDSEVTSLALTPRTPRTPRQPPSLSPGATPRTPESASVDDSRRLCADFNIIR